MSNIIPIPTPGPFIRAVLAAADIQDRDDSRLVASLRPYEFQARKDLIQKDGYAPHEATRAVLNLRWETRHDRG